MISHTEYVNTGGLYSKQGSGSIRRFVVLQIARQRKHKLKRRLEGFLQWQHCKTNSIYNYIPFGNLLHSY